MRTGILGGTFDPIHVAHLHAAETALFQADLDRVLLMPAGDPWQKSDVQVSPAGHRMAMTQVAIEEVDGLVADDREVARRGPTFTADTLATFPTDEELVLIVGADAAAGIRTWERHGEVLARSEILVVPRPGTDTVEVARLLPEARFLDMALLGVSGTDIRARIREGRPFRFLVTDPVYRYIVEHHLYRNDAEDDMVVAPRSMEESS